MFTDIVGYTSLSQHNEELALRVLHEHRKVVRLLIQKHHGNEIKTIGDAFLIEFTSALEATNCAYEIQCALHEYNSDGKGVEAVKVRIGIHVGDVVHSENDVYGDAVNLASRIEAIAEPGGIAISGQVHDNVRNKVEFPLEYIGAQDLKNVDAPLEAYRVCFPWDEGITAERSVLESVQRARAPQKEEPSSMPMFDRESERASLLSALDEVVGARKARVIFIGGEAGIGKTRLLNWITHEALEKYDVYVARGYCLEDVSVPYFPFSEALSGLLRDRSYNEGTKRVLNWLDRALRRTFAQGGEEFERYKLYENMAKLLETISGERPVLIDLEDVQWSDSASLGLLHYLARNIQKSRVLMICTYRIEELGELAPGRPHNLKETMRLMRREGLFQTIELRGLPIEALTDLTGSLIPGAPGPVLQLVAGESDGNPFYAIESTRFLIETGAIEKMEGVWASRIPSGQIEIPNAILDVIARRLSRLTQEDRQLLDCASVIGEHFDPRVLSSALGIDELSCVQRLARLNRETWLVVEDKMGYRFDHAKVREAVFRGLTGSLAKELHRRVAGVLSGIKDSSLAAEIAYHYQQSGDVAKSIEFGMLAGDQAKSISSFAEAASSYTLVLEAARSDGERAEICAKAHGSRAEALHEQGLHQKAIEDCKEALSLSKVPSTRLNALRVLAGSFLGMGHFSEALEAVRKADKEPGEEVLERLYLKDIEQTITARRSGYSTTTETAREISRAYLKLGRRKDYAYSILAVAEHGMMTKLPPDFFQVVKEASGIFEESGELAGQKFVHEMVAEYYFTKGDVALSADNYLKAASLCKRLGLYGNILWVTWYLAMLYENAGLYDDTIRVALDGLEAAAIAEAPYPESGIYATLARSYLRINRVDDAKKALVRMNELYEAHSKDASAGLQGLVERARALNLSFEGRREDADKAYENSIVLLKRFGMWVHEAEARREYGELLLEQRRSEEAKNQFDASLNLFASVDNAPGMEKIRNALSRA
jgi:class 3 adenylate cyclase/tetratricopeptide (TPR) repeat protein/ABC-type transporter Mla MlaB component